MNIILCFSGGIGSGKSSISSELAKKLNWRKTGFGDYLRQYSKKQGLDPTRETLQKLGVEKISQGWDSFCSDVLKFENWENGDDLIIDGIRHIDAIKTLEKITHPSILKLFYLQLDIDKRAERISNVTNFEELKKQETHSTETEVKTVLLERADLVLDSNLPISEISSQILKFLKMNKIF